MSKLKIASCFEFEKVLRGMSNKLFYSKSEVDAVIDKLKDELENQKWRGDEWARNANDKDKQIVELKDENRRLKRALCLAKAEACMHKRWRTDDGFDYARSHRHMNKWLSIAEKFKESK